MATDLKPTKTPTAAASPAKSAVSSLALGNADDALTLAKELQKFVKENKLTSNIQGKEFPNVEAWQFAGSLLGLSPMLESIEDKSTESEIKWNATVSLHNLRTGSTVGRGFATCSNKESTKKFFADYAICSMAQTRAVGKAYRLSLGWLMKAAGYEATPAEEMSDIGTEASVVEAPKKPQAEASAPASAPLAASTTAVPSGGLNVELESALQHIIRELTSHHITPIERNKMMLGLNGLTLEKAQKCLANLSDTIEYRTSPEALNKARLDLRSFANKHAAALGDIEYNKLHQRSLALTVTAVDLIQEVQEAEQRLKTPQIAAA